ncbi:MAG: cation transporter [Bacilli bacterium]|nr:cation transporter [Bacilli bacterium]
MKKAIKKYKALEKSDKIIVFLLFITFSNTIMAAVKFTVSLVLPSLWFFVNAIFNIILALARIFSIRDYRKIRKQSNYEEKKRIALKNYVNNGILLILLGISYFAVSVYMYYKGTNTTMHEYLTYLVALIAFYSIGSAIYGMCKYHKNNNAVLSAVKITSFANALTSIVLTQVVLLDTYNTTNFDLRIANGCTGMGVSLVIMGLGLFMIINSKKD